jgi:hypothetical protein
VTFFFAAYSSSEKLRCMSSLAISGRRRDSKLATALLEVLQEINQRFP